MAISPTATSRSPALSTPARMASRARSQSSSKGLHRNSGENLTSARLLMGRSTWASGASSSGVRAPSGWPASRYRSMMVWSRIAPSRWRWSSTLGRERRSMAREPSVRGRAGAVGGARGRRRTSTRADSIRSESREGRMLLEGKRLLITGVLTRDSIAYSVAEAAQEQGAELVLTSFGRAMSLTEKSAKRLPQPVDVLEMDANNPDHIQAVADDLAKRWGRVDGFLHAIAFAPRDALGGNFLNTPWESVQTALQTSAYSLKAIAVGML